MGGETSIPLDSDPLEYVLTGPPETHVSHDAPRFHHDDQLRQQPLLVATSATMLKISSFFMAFLIGSAGTIPRPTSNTLRLGDVQLYITVDEVQLRLSTIFDNLLPKCDATNFVW